MPAAVTYTTVLGQVLMENRGGIVTEFVPDPLGSVVKHKDSTGAYVHSAEYWPYGEIQTSTGNNPNNFAYCGTWGYYRDNASQTYVRARYYKPVQGRWMTVDPLWPSGSAFDYAFLSPLLYIDISGLQSVSTGQLSAALACCNAQKEPAYRAGDDFCSKHGFGKNVDGTICNAFTHCMVACLIAQKCDSYGHNSGPKISKDCTDMHERDAPEWWKDCPGYRPVPTPYKPNPETLKCMDLYNNAIGINCSSSADCATCCSRHAKNGGFQIIVPPKSMPPGWRRSMTDCKTNPKGVKMPPLYLWG